MDELLTDLHEFRTTLERTPAAAIELSDDTRARYRNGHVPRVLHWLVRHPVLLHALMRDAEAQCQGSDATTA